MSRFTSLSTALLVGLGLGAFAVPASAQDEPASEPEESEEAVPTRDVIVVTAQKREQSILDVPIAVSSYSGDLLENAGVRDIRDVTAVSPSLFFTATSSEVDGTARIRGIGTVGNNFGLESSVPVFVDGVYRNRSGVAFTELGDLDRIEVLRGPQGTLFGRNASAGLISIVTKRPTDEFEAYVEGTYGNYNYWRVQGAVGGPIKEGELRARLYGVMQQRDGFFEDVNTGREFNDRDRFLVRGTVEWEPTDTLSISFIADYAEREEQCCAAPEIVPGVRSVIAGIVAADTGLVHFPGGDIYDRKVGVTPGRDFLEDTQDWGVSAEINWDLGFGTLTSITAYRDFEAINNQDPDFGGADIWYREDRFRGFETFSEELRLQGEAGWLDWLVGFWYSDEKLESDDALLMGTDFARYWGTLFLGGAFDPDTSASIIFGPGGTLAAFTPGDGGFLDSQQDGTTIALFTHNVISITDRLALTLGGRGTYDEKDLTLAATTVNPGCLTSIDGTPNPLGAAIFCLPFWNPLLDGALAGLGGALTDNHIEREWSATANLNYRWTDNFSTYASYSRGYKAGGFNLDRAGFNNQLAPDGADLQFPAEIVDAFELGAKASMLDNMVDMSVALFDMNFDNYQLNTFNGVQFVVNSIPVVYSDGVEVEIAARPMEGLNLLTGVTWTDTKYGDLADGVLPPQADRQMTNAPKWVATAAATYRVPVASTLEMLFHLNGRYTSAYNTGSDLDPPKEQDEFFIMDGRIGIGAQDGRWNLELWARNLTDVEYTQVAFDTPLQNDGPGSFAAFLGQPRTFGATLRVSY